LPAGTPSEGHHPAGDRRNRGDRPLRASLVGVGGRVGADLDSRLAAVCQRITEGNRKQLARVSLADLTEDFLP
jgi:hypothetical protein